MAFTYPISLELNGKNCLVVGGGQVAERKILSLLEQGALVEVLSPQLTERLQALQMQGRLTWRDEAYTARHLAGKFLTIAATDQPMLNEQIGRDCQERNILVNVIDQKEAGNFIVNAHFEQGDLQIAISTGGVSPAMAKHIKEELAEIYGAEYQTALQIIKEARAEALATIGDASKRRIFLQMLAQMDLATQLKQTTKEDVQKRVRKCLSSYWD